jgi:hypothetical protein
VALAIQATEELMDSVYTGYSTGISGRSFAQAWFKRPSKQAGGKFRAFSWRNFARIGAGAALAFVFFSSALVLVSTPKPGFEIISSDVPSVADVEDWLMARGRLFD